MSRFFDELERRLRKETTERYSSQPREGPVPAQARRRPTFVRQHRRLLVLAAVALAALAVPALGAVSDLWQPDVRPAPSMRSRRAVRGISFSCRQETSRRVDAGPPVGRTFTSVLAVLARPRTTADVPERRYMQTPFARDIDVKGIRYLGSAPDGHRYYVIPAGGAGLPRPAEDCLRRLPNKLRRSYEHQPRQEPTICVAGDGGGGCSSLADVRAHGSWGASGTGGSSSVAGVVPNGVHAIRVTYGRSTRTFKVSDNFFAFRVALEAPQAVRPDRLVWELDDGTVRDVTRPAAPSRPTP